MKRETRNLQHEKGGRIREVRYQPIRSDGQDGEARIYNEDLYIKTKGRWVKLMSGDKIINQELVRNIDLIVSEGVLQHSSLTGVTADQHHAEVHALASHSDVSDVTGSGTVLATSTSPVFVTPTLGAAIATSVDFGSTTLLASRSLTVDTGGVFNIALASAGGDDFTVDTNKLVVEGDSGNVGIGEAAPAKVFHVAGGATQQIATFRSTTDTAEIEIGDDVDYIYVGVSDDGAGGVGVGYLGFNQGENANNLNIDANGNVGIGTSAPYSPLHIASAAEGAIADGSANIPQVLIEGSGSTIGAFSPTLCLHNSSTGVDNDYIGAIQFTADDSGGTGATPNLGGQYATISARIIDETDGSSSGAMYFDVETNDTSTTGITILGATAGGVNVGIGETAPDTQLEVLKATTQLKLSHDGTYNTTFGTDGSGDLTITPSGDDVFLGGGSSIGTADFSSGSTGWRVTDPGVADFRTLTADELHVKSFIADIYSALAGGLIITKGRARVSRDFTIPNTDAGLTLYVEDHEGAENAAVFTANDYVKLNIINTANGLVVTPIYGQVTNHTNLTGGEQSWTFTTTTPGYSSEDIIRKGSIALDYGAAGSNNGIWEATVLDASNSPYSQCTQWTGVSSGVPTAASVRTRVGSLNGISNATNNFGIWAGNGTTAGTNAFMEAGDQGIAIHDGTIKLYDGTTAKISLDPSTPHIAIGATLPTALATNDGVWISPTQFRVGDVNGEQLVWDGSDLYIKTSDTIYTKHTGSAIEFYDDIGSSAVKKMSISGGSIVMRNDDDDADVAVWNDDVITLGDQANTQIVITGSGGSAGVTIGSKISLASTGVATVTDILLTGRIDNTDGSGNNIIIGQDNPSTSDNTTGTYFKENILIGSGVGQEVNTDSDDIFTLNVAIGHQAMNDINPVHHSNDAVSNVAIGHAAMQDYHYGSGNVAIGKGALISTDGTGSNNIAIGTTAGGNVTSGSGNVVIGDKDFGSDDGDDQLIIASGGGNVTWITGDSRGNVELASDLSVPGNILMTDENYIGISGAEQILFDGAGSVEVNGASLGVNCDPSNKFHVNAATDDGLRITSGNTELLMTEDAQIAGFFRIRPTVGDGIVFTGNDDTPILTLVEATHRTGIGCAIDDPPEYTLDIRGVNEAGENADNYLVRIWHDGGGAEDKGLLIQCGEDAIGTSGVSEVIWIGFADGDGDFKGAITSTNGHGGFEAEAGGVNFAHTSDIRLKENIADTQIDALSRINSLRFREFNWKEGTGRGSGRSCKLGLIAQEVEVLDTGISGIVQTVLGTTNGLEDLRMVSYTQTVPYLLKAMQELSAKVTALEAQIN